jgi:hypothetical protein
MGSLFIFGKAAPLKDVRGVQEEEKTLATRNISLDSLTLIV